MRCVKVTSGSPLFQKAHGDLESSRDGFRFGSTILPNDGSYWCLMKTFVNLPNSSF